MIRRLGLLVRSRIAVKLTLTLVGFVGISTLGASLYLNHALEAFAVEALEGAVEIDARGEHRDGDEAEQRQRELDGDPAPDEMDQPLKHTRERPVTDQARAGSRRR